MKTLLLLRHAKSSSAEPGLPDHDRPLNERGKRDAPRVGQLLKEHGLTPNLILSSTARRARKTAEKVADNCGYAGEIELSQALYQAQPADCLRCLQEVSDEHGCVMLVGHNPTLEELLAQVTGQQQSLPTAALAVVEFPVATWKEMAAAPAGRLLHLWRPKEVA